MNGEETHMTYKELLAFCENLPTSAFKDGHVATLYEEVHKTKTLFPFPKKYYWHSLENILTEHPPQGTIACVTPILWQLDPLVYGVARKFKKPITYVSTDNIDILNILHAEAPIDTVITSNECIESVIKIFEKVRNPPSTVIIIYPLMLVPTLPYKDYSFFKNTYTEIHLSPGYTLISQAPPTKKLILQEDITWDFKENTTYIRLTKSQELISKIVIELPLCIKKKKETGDIYIV